MKLLIPSLVFAAALLCAVPARSAETEKTPQEIENLAKELVRKLGDDDFREREAAGQELEKLGLGARKAIEEGRKSPDPEIAARCESLIPKIRMLDLKRRIEELAADKEGRIENTLPLGVTYEKICGKDENARKFYIELCRNNLLLLDDAANDPQTMCEAYFNLVNEISNRGDGVLSPGVWAAETVSVTEGAAMLLIGADEEIAPSIVTANRLQPDRRNYQPMIGVLWQPQYRSAMIDANSGRYFRKLLFAWAKRHPEPLAMQSLLFLIQDIINKQTTTRQSDSDTLEFLMDFAVSTSAQNLLYQKGTAMAMVAAASISENERISYFEEKLFKDETTLAPEVSFDSEGQTKIRVETRACDYALAVCVKLSGQSFKDYGFDILGSHSDKFNSWECAGFTKDETRKAAFKKYEEWRKANPIKNDDN